MQDGEKKLVFAMTEKNGDSRKTLEEIVRQLIAAAHEGKISPVFVGMNVVITPGGDSPFPLQHARGDGTEPEIEVQSVGDRVLLVTEMPGLPPESIRVLFRGDRVFVWGKYGERQYRSSARVPPPSEGSEEITYRHGVLEISYVPLAEHDAGEAAPPS